MSYTDVPLNRAHYSGKTLDIQRVAKEGSKYPSGWLSPDGHFEECSFAEHTEVALMIIEETCKQRYRHYRLNVHLIYPGDYLVQEEGYVLFHNPRQNGFLSIDYNKLSPFQQGFIEEMLFLTGNTDKIKEILDED